VTLAGLGIALLPAFAITRHVENGALVAVLPGFSTTIQLQILTLAVRHVPHRVALLRDFLVSHLAGTCTKHG
jgi:DNA-binding transcriptional LysR family regulator